jgi:hypothetical protein
MKGRPKHAASDSEPRRVSLRRKWHQAHSRAHNRAAQSYAARPDCIALSAEGVSVRLPHSALGKARGFFTQPKSGVDQISAFVHAVLIHNYRDLNL